MVSTNDIKAGQVIIVEGSLMLILEQQHIKPGKGKAFVRTKLKNLENYSIIDKTFRSDENVESAYIDKETYKYIYSSSGMYTFMNSSDYSQIEVSEKFIEKSKNFLTERSLYLAGTVSVHTRFSI